MVPQGVRVTSTPTAYKPVGKYLQTSFWVRRRSARLRLRRNNSPQAIQNVTPICYAAAVAESGRPDRRTMCFGPGLALLRFPNRHAYSETPCISAEVER